MKVNLKNEKGFTSVDLGIAMMIVVIFVTIMSSLIYSVYITSTEAKRTATALNYAVAIFENIGALSYSEVYGENVLSTTEGVNVTSVESSSNVTTGKIGGYDINLKITDPYGDNKVKLITLTITYPVSAKNSEVKTEKVELKRIKTIS